MQRETEISKEIRQRLEEIEAERKRLEAIEAERKRLSDAAKKDAADARALQSTYNESWEMPELYPNVNYPELNANRAAAIERAQVSARKEFWMPQFMSALPEMPKEVCGLIAEFCENQTVISLPTSVWSSR